MERFIAHRTEDGREQTIKEHLQGTADRAAAFAAIFGQEKLGRLAGFIHDVGKYTPLFQRRIRGENVEADHSTAGGYELMKLGLMPLAYCVMGHHGGLPDGGKKVDTAEKGTLMGRILRIRESRTPDMDYSAFQKEIILEKTAWAPPKLLLKGGFTVSFWIRMLYSCLVDADFLDTEAFMQGGTVQRGRAFLAEELLCKLTNFIAGWWKSDVPINQKRCEVLRQCIEAGEREKKGLFTLTVPTGGGKTVSSLAFALHHAKAKGLRRVVYVIPYCSIIEQTADTFCKILGKENVLEHYAEADFGDDPVKKLAAENWDMPVIVTTAVQFFESLFANKPSRCRKLHNLADSVIIFDEAQTLPLRYLKPCLQALAELTENYGASCVLCTATQPALGPLLKEIGPQFVCREITQDPKELYRFFRRVTFRQLGKLEDEELAQRLNGEKQALCIVGTRKQAQKIFSLLKEEGSFHLSTLMDPAHRRRVLRIIRARLRKGKPCRVVATSLIEAGVDVDFPAVYRAQAGLDSMIQAAGRCNRENKRPKEKSFVYLFEPQDEYCAHLPHSLRRPVDTAQVIGRKFEEIDAPEAIEAYFSELYRVSGPELDEKNILSGFEEAQNGLYPFAETAQKFHLIENDTRAVVISRTAAAQKLVRRLKGGEYSRALLRQLGRYSVNVYPNHFKALFEQDKLEFLDGGKEGIAVLRDLSCYSGKTGLALLPESGAALFDS